MIHLRIHLFIYILFFSIPVSVIAHANSTTVVKNGIDNLIDTKFELLREKNVVLVTHSAARTITGISTLDAFRACTTLHIRRVLAPEHGFFGTVHAGDHVAADTVDGLEIASLYGALRRPTTEMLTDADVVVIDMQDIGVRSYTYISTAIEVMHACARDGKPVMILDRPNPLGGDIMDGPIASDSMLSFVARVPIPYVHGLTLGELATMAKGEGWVDRSLSLTIVKCKRWTRSMSWEDTKLEWYPTSPNIPSIQAVRGYATTGLLGELGGVSIGINTTSPFTVVGAPGLAYDSSLVHTLKRYGVHLRSIRFVPRSGKLQNTTCTGYQLSFPERISFRPYAAALTLIGSIQAQTNTIIHDTTHKSANGKMFTKVTADSTLVVRLRTDKNLGWIDDYAQSTIAGFSLRRNKYLLYR